ncbi:MAG: glycosyltransferase family 39 protein [Elusimicrobia bacterium]|nr:glycosyltransferase family 39 protein [Elusimicrobiota bacterium]
MVLSHGELQNAIMRRFISSNPRLLLFFAALITRAVMAWYIGSGDHGDDDGTYINMGMHILNGEGAWVSPMNMEKARYHSYLPPGMGYLMALCQFFTPGNFEPLRWPIIILSAGACLWLADIGKMLLGKWGGLAGWIWALYPPQLFWSTRVNPHAIATDLLTLALLWTLKISKSKDNSRWLPFFCGVVLAVLTLFRGEYLIGAVILGAYLLWIKRSWQRPAIFGIGFFLMMSPWVIRNWIIHRAFVPVSTNSSRMMWETYNSQYHFSGVEVPFLEENSVKFERLNELEFRNILTKEALDYIKNNPARALYIFAGNLVHFWRPFVTPGAASLGQNLLYVFSYVPLFSLCLTGLYIAPYKKEPFWTLIAVIILYKWSIHAFFYIIIRFRESIAPVLILPAALAVVKSIEEFFPSDPAQKTDFRRILAGIF